MPINEYDDLEDFEEDWPDEQEQSEWWEEEQWVIDEAEQRFEQWVESQERGAS